MGQKQYLHEYEQGGICGGCVEVLWPVLGTPKYVYVRASLIELCPQAWCVNQPRDFNDHAFKLTQHDISRCIWQYSSSKFFLEYCCDELPDHKSHLYLDGFDGDDWDGIFRSTTGVGEKCVTFFNNQLGCGAPHICGTGGYAIVTWREESIVLMDSLNMAKSNKVLMEMFPLANGRKVYKYCRLQDGTNVKILVEA